MKRKAAIALICLSLSGCVATAEHQGMLNAVEAKCATGQYPIDCAEYLPQMRAIVAQENADNANRVALGVVGVLALVAAAALDDDGPHYHHYHHRH